MIVALTTSQISLNKSQVVVNQLLCNWIKMPNVLQTHHYIFLPIPKLKIFKEGMS